MHTSTEALSRARRDMAKAPLPADPAADRARPRGVGTFDIVLLTLCFTVVAVLLVMGLYVTS